MSYMIAEGQPNDRAVYYTGQEAFHGGELWGNVEEAKLFDSMKDVAEFLMKRNDLRLIITEISDVTFEKVKQGYKDLWKEETRKSEAAMLYHKFNTVSYITNSERRN